MNSNAEGRGNVRQHHLHRARFALEAWGAAHPDVWRAVDECRASRRDTWPSYVFLPLGESIRLMGEYERRRTGMGASLWSADELAVYSSWRVTQGIYRFDPTLYDALVKTPITGNIPGELLRYMPEWCVYVETPGLTVPTLHGAEVALHGVWARLDHARKNGRDVLALALDADGGMASVQLTLFGTLEQALQRAVTADRVSPPEEYIAAAHRTYASILSLLLYLCSEGAEVGTGPIKPSYPRAKLTKRGLRVFAADAPTAWEVGVRIGAALRQARQTLEVTAATRLTGRQHQPHVRVMHWHTFLAGPDRTQRRVKWMPPIKVKFVNPEDLTAVIRGVE